MTKQLKYLGWRATGFLSQGFALITALLAKGIGYSLQGIHLATVRSLVTVAKWFAMTAAECHISASLLAYEPKTYDQ